MTKIYVICLHVYMVYTVQNYSEMHEFFVVCFDDYVIDARESAERITDLCQTVRQEYHTCKVASELVQQENAFIKCPNKLQLYPNT